MSEEEKIEVLEISLEAINEVVIEKLIEFQVEIKESVEGTKSELINIRKELNDIRKELHEDTPSADKSELDNIRKELDNIRKELHEHTQSADKSELDNIRKELDNMRKFHEHTHSTDKSELDNIRKELDNIRKELHEHTQSADMCQAIGQPLSSSSPKADRNEQGACGNPMEWSSGLFPFRKVPSVLDDVDSDTRELIKDFMPSTLDPKEKLTPAQYAYVMYWVADRKPETARKGMAVSLREDGIRAGMWGPSWKPPGITTGSEAYLIEKIKSALRKQKKNALKAGIKRKIEDASRTEVV